MATEAAVLQRQLQRPLCVDLDGTLIRTDMLWESLFLLLKRQPLAIFLLPLWLSRGKAHLKARIAERVEIDAETLPYAEEFLDWLRAQKAGGRELVLTTATNECIAARIAAHLGIFDRVLASDEVTNLAGARKRERLLQEYGEGGFDYAGNAPADLMIWPHAAEGVLVNPLRGVRQAAQRLGRAQRVLADPDVGLRPYLKAMRPHQWLKNVLIFVPLALAHELTNVTLLLQAAVAFLAFSLCASSVYLLNDLLDLPADRRHPTKRRRPFAAGDLPIQSGVVLMAGLLAAAVGLAALLPIGFLGLLATYYVATLAYSFRFKQAALVDVLVLAGLYTIRILAGAAAVAVEPSFWLLAFSMFFFLSLALVKRYSELLTLRSEGRVTAAGRGYGPHDLETLSQLGTASGYMAVLVLALYISSDQVRILYSRPEAIWLLCPLLLYWISRVWMMTRRDEMHEDPVVFAVEDRRSHLLALIGLATMAVAL